MDGDALPFGGGGAEDSYYLGRRPSYYAANRPFHGAGELRLVRGVDQGAWQRLRPHVAALPGATGVNVNTATAQVLAATVRSWGSQTRALARGEERSRQTDREPFSSTEAFAEAALPGDTERPVQGITTQTQFFRAHIRARFGRVEHRLATVYRRANNRTEIVRHRREIP